MNEVLSQAIEGAGATRGVGAIQPAPSARPGSARRAGERDFAGLLARELGSQREVKFSAHAQSRMEARALDLSDAETASLRTAVDLAAAKGARQSLVMLNSLALIVNIPSRTVITAMESDGARGTVFTNIDSAVVCSCAT